MQARPQSPSDANVDRRSPGLIAYLVVLTAAAIATAVAVAPLQAPATPSWPALPVLGVLLVAATWFVVPFRYGESVDAVNLVEAALAPLLIAYPPLVVVAVVAASQVANGLLRRLSLDKTVFNTAMWALAAGLGGAVLAEVGPGPVWPHLIAGLLATLVVVGLVNNIAFATVLALTERERLRDVATIFRPVVTVAWLGGWGVNVAVGLLFALAYLASPVAVVVFAVPLVVLHLAYRSYSSARADQARLATAHRAASRLSAPLEPLDAVPQFLADVAECFDAGRVQLVLRTDRGRQIHRVDRATGRYGVRSESDDVCSLEAAVAASPGPVRVSAGGSEPVSQALTAAGISDCLAVPLLDGDRLVGTVMVLDRGGFEGSRTGELAVLETLARETTGALAKGRLLGDVLEERRKLAEIVETASDGICTFGDDGAVLSWNPALERITGLSADEVVGRSDVVERLELRTAADERLDLRRRPLASLPTEIRLTAPDGTIRHLTCSYSEGRGGGDDTGTALIVMARDVTPVGEHEALREQFHQLVEADAARRGVVEQLQQAVVPAPVEVPGAKVSAVYEASDPSAPTGGDLYDWQVLPSGEVHLAVVDVLGHGVAATKDALAVVHTLRSATAAGTPLEGLVAHTDELLHAQHPDLVATVIVARYAPDTGRLRLAVGGHPPALVIKADGEVLQVAASGGAVGWPGAGSDQVADTMLEPGDALVLYTDGLIEARKDILSGMETLMRHATDLAELPAAELARQLLSRTLAGAERRDDTLALVLRRDLVRDDEAVWEFAPTAAEASAARQQLDEWLRDRDVDGDDAVAAAAELLSNAVRYARRQVRLQVELVDTAVVVDVRDDGVGCSSLARRGDTQPGDDAEGGRGLFLVRALSDQVDVHSGPHGSSVRAIIPRQAADRALTPASGPRHASAGDQLPARR